VNALVAKRELDLCFLNLAMESVNMERQNKDIEKLHKDTMLIEDEIKNECFYCYEQFNENEKIWAVWSIFEAYSCNNCFIENLPKDK
jgi:hypothetical protein